MGTGCTIKRRNKMKKVGMYFLCGVLFGCAEQPVCVPVPLEPEDQNSPAIFFPEHEVFLKTASIEPFGAEAQGGDTDR